MNTLDITEKVKTVVDNVMNTEVSPEDSFESTLGCDSLDTVEIVIGIETEFGIDLEDDEIENLTTVQKLINYVEKRYQEQANSF